MCTPEEAKNTAVLNHMMSGTPFSVLPIHANGNTRYLIVVPAAGAPVGEIFPPGDAHTKWAQSIEPLLNQAVTDIVNDPDTPEEVREAGRRALREHGAPVEEETATDESAVRRLLASLDDGED